MVLKLKLSKMYPLVTGNRKSDGAEYNVRNIELVHYEPGGGEPERILVRLSGDMAVNAEKQIQPGIDYFFDVKFDVDDYTSQDGRHFPKQQAWLRNFWQAGAEKPNYEPFDQPY